VPPPAAVVELKIHPIRVLQQNYAVINGRRSSALAGSNSFSSSRGPNAGTSASGFCKSHPSPPTTRLLSGSGFAELNGTQCSAIPSNPSKIERLISVRCQNGELQILNMRKLEIVNPLFIKHNSCELQQVVIAPISAQTAANISSTNPQKKVGIGIVMARL
jgi:hypothetical protein